MAKAPSTQVTLIRSGRTAWDDAGRLQGRADLPATESGLASCAAELRAWTEGQQTLPAVVYSADDEGAIATAHTAAAAFDAKHKSVEGIAAINMGLWEGLTAEDLEDRHPKSFRSWREHPATVNVPEGEPVLAFIERAAGALLKLLDKHPKKPFAVVLRPLEFAIIDRLLAGEPLIGLGVGDLHEGPGLTVHDMSAERIRALLEGVKAGV